ncbi:recombinase family protein [Mesorhizobium sp. WSM3882]|uniref:recombinase family protein n=1 Tax=Mesorhizobium sp. WSM3882 TaxID=2029407 RepID=UPI000BAF708B|nr:recombinase family protein [Mesorhizobium sp. WSM3882]PBB31103.1 hypothetical protein CK214_18970 [Mesorhizobium sp. WSM3882]
MSSTAADTTLATITDRIARDPLDMLTILGTVKAAGAGLRLLDEPFIGTTSEMSDLILYVVGWAAQWMLAAVFGLSACSQTRNLR